MDKDEIGKLSDEFITSLLLVSTSPRWLFKATSDLHILRENDPIGFFVYVSKILIKSGNKKLSTDTVNISNSIIDKEYYDKLDRIKTYKFLSELENHPEYDSILGSICTVSDIIIDMLKISPVKYNIPFNNSLELAKGIFANPIIIYNELEEIENLWIKRNKLTTPSAIAEYMSANPGPSNVSNMRLPKSAKDFLIEKTLFDDLKNIPEFKIFEANRKTPINMDKISDKAKKIIEKVDKFTFETSISSRKELREIKTNLLVKINETKPKLVKLSEMIIS